MGPFELLEVAGSGLGAERVRMSVITQNIANANVTSTPEGGPFRRRIVQFQTILQESRRWANGGVPAGGVRVSGIRTDHATPLRKVRDPSHPHADADGWVSMPNVDLAMEMVDLMNASKSYEANLASIRVYREMMQQTMQITR